MYYTVYRGIGTDSVTSGDRFTGNNVVVRSYTGYNNVPSIDKKYIEDVYVVGAKAHAIENSNSPVYYTAQVVVIELGSEYNKYDSEQVFIPDFSEVTNSVGIENVTMIRGNGVKETVQVDMTKSHIDSSYYYDPANGSIHGNRIPGLYFMDPSDSDPNVYVIQRMTPADVRDNDYLVGYVRESYNTLSNNYAQINTRVRPAGAGRGYVDTETWQWNTAWFGDNGNLIAADATTPKIPEYSAEWQSKAFGTDSKAYTYGGSTASLNEVPATEALAQYRQDNAGTTISGLNERWNQSIGDATDPNAFNQNNLNEVLVRYSGGTVVYAISFNETDNKAAQKVWWNYLPLDGIPQTGIDDNPTLTGEGTDLNQYIISNTNPIEIRIPYTVWSTQPGTRVAADGSFTVTFKAPENCTIAKNGTAFLKSVEEKIENVAALAHSGNAHSVTVMVKGEDGTQLSYTYNIKFVAGVTTFGDLKSKDAGRAQIISVDNTANVATIYFPNAATTKLSSLEEVLYTTATGDKVTVLAYDATYVVDKEKSKMNNANFNIDQAALIEIQIENADGAIKTLTVAEDDGTNATHIVVTIDENITAYEDKDFTKELPVTVVAGERQVWFEKDAGGNITVYLSAKGNGKFTIKESGQADVVLQPSDGTASYDTVKDITTTWASIRNGNSIIFTKNAKQDTFADTLKFQYLKLADGMVDNFNVTASADYLAADGSLTIKEYTSGDGSKRDQIRLVLKDAATMPDVTDTTTWNNAAALRVLNQLFGLDLEENGQGFYNNADGTKTYVSTGTLSIGWEISSGLWLKLIAQDIDGVEPDYVLNILIKNP